MSKSLCENAGKLLKMLKFWYFSERSEIFQQEFPQRNRKFKGLYTKKIGLKSKNRKSSLINAI